MDNIPLFLDWIAALRSGQYRQGRENLSVNGRDCCLGVLAKIARLRSKPSKYDPTLLVFFWGGDTTPHAGFLPDGFAATLGLTAGGVLSAAGLAASAHAFPQISHPSMRRSLSVANDNGATFPQIADFLYNAVVMDQLFNIQYFDTYPGESI